MTQSHRRFRSPAVVDYDMDVFGAEAAAGRLTERIEDVRAGEVRLPRDGGASLRPPFAPARDHVEGPISASVTLVVFGAFGAASSRPLGRVLAAVRRRHPIDVRIVWRHHPEPSAHPRATLLALAAEAAAAQGRFWALTHELLALRHAEPIDFHAAVRRAGLDHGHTLEAMRASTGAERIVDDVASALASGVTSPPALFVGRERYRGELDPVAVSAAVAAAQP